MSLLTDQAVLHVGDCLDVLRTMPDCSVDSVVTDPPYGLAFMGKKWDYDVPSEDIWRECLRVLKPGGHLLAFAGTRTQHRMAVRIEDAGFEIRDMIAWVYGSGFPKSHNLRGDWAGFGTALKPALEPITLARKPLAGTVAANVLEHGTGAINVDGCRVGTDDDCARKPAIVRDTAAGFGKGAKMGGRGHASGRWPANLIHDGSEEVVGLFPVTTTGKPTVGQKPTTGKVYGGGYVRSTKGGGDSGSAARFFYCAKASKRDRDEGLNGFEQSTLNMSGGRKVNTSKGDGKETREIKPRANNHPTVKPTDLMRYLCRLVTPPNGVVLDPFMGSGSTGKAAILEGFNFIGIEREPEYVNIARARVECAQTNNSISQQSAAGQAKFRWEAS